MANNKMLIDASHPEETRVVVVRGNRVEEFDFEAQEKRQLRGNIYLAKVTRVEPSLQAAFIDYGGNRHGFLAFSEIHPDYYQIPAADRQALLDEEEEAQAAEAEEEEERSSSRRSRRRGRKSAATSEAGDEDNGDTGNDDADNGEDEPDEEDENETPHSNADAALGDGTEEGEIVLVAADEVSGDGEDDDDSNDDSDDDDDEDENDDSRTMAAVIETDSISEPADEPEEGDDGETAAAEEEEKPKKRTRRAPRKKKADAEAEAEGDGATGDAGAEAADSKEEKPKKTRAKSTTTRKRKSKKDAEAEAESAEETATVEADASENAVEAVEEEKPKKRTRRTSRKKKEEAETAEQAPAEAEANETADESAAEAAETGDDSGAEEKPKRSRRRSTRGGRRRGRKSEDTDEEVAASEGAAGSGATNGEIGKDGDDFESVGSEDALEEVPRRARPRRSYKIQEVIRRRQVMLVQVVKEERGTKGAALTTYLSLAGRYSVLMPNTARGGGISRKITNPADRKRLKEIAGSLDVPKGMGVILRTAGASRSAQEISRDFDYLMRLWENVRSLTLASTAPCLVYEEGSLIKRSIRDLYDKDIGEITVSGTDGYHEAKDFMKMLMPSHARNVKLHRGDQPLLSKFGVESQLDKMLAPQVTLKSGGYLVINQTEALVAIDVNSGRSTREHSIEATALQTNLEAAEEVARQLRLRDLAGLIVIDFIDMEEKRNNRSVEKKLKECLKNDRARIQVGHISHFGLLEMSRQRIRASVLESTMEPCPHCGGSGHIRSGSSFAIQVVRAIEDHLNRNSRNDLIVKLHPAAAIYILNHKRQSVTMLEERYGVSIAFETDAALSDRDFNIEKGAPSTRAPKASTAADAVSMPDADDEEAALDEADETTADVDAGETDRDGDDDQRSGRKRRKRRGRRGRGRDRDASAEDESSDEAAADDSDESDDQEPAEEEAVESASEETDTTEDKEDAKPRRGRRPRKQKAQTAEEAGETVSVETASDGEASGDAAENAVENGSDAEAAPARSRATRRTGRPGKKVRAEEDTASEEDVAEQAAEEQPETAENETRDTAPPRARERRNTRRVRKAKSEDGAEAETSEDMADDDMAAGDMADGETSDNDEVANTGNGEDAPAAENGEAETSADAAEEVAGDTSGDEGEGTKKKSGWWGKGGFL